MKKVVCLSNKVRRLLPLCHSGVSSGVRLPVAPAEPELFCGFLEFFGGSQPCVCERKVVSHALLTYLLPMQGKISLGSALTAVLEHEDFWAAMRGSASNLPFLVVSSKGKKAVDFSMVGISQPMHHLHLLHHLPRRSYIWNPTASVIHLPLSFVLQKAARRISMNCSQFHS